MPQSNSDNKNMKTEKQIYDVHKEWALAAEYWNRRRLIEVNKDIELLQLEIDIAKKRGREIKNLPKPQRGKI